MRLKEDSSSWKSSSIQRRDFRHDPGLPETEIPRHRSKRSKNEKRKSKRIDHKHVWVESTYHSDSYYWFAKRDDPPPRMYTRFDCEIPGCKAHKHISNPRYGYEYWKWRKRNGRAY